MPGRPVLLPGFIDSGDVRLGNLVFNTYDVNGVAWVLTDMDGWWDLPEVSIPDDPRPFEQDGSYLTPGRYMPRVVSLTGTLVPPSSIQKTITPKIPARNLASYARHALGASLDLARRAGVLQVDEEVPKQAEVQLANRPSFRNSRVNGATDFMIPLKAGDPRKYAQAQTVLSGGVTVQINANNLGTYDTGAVIRIDGPITNPIVEHLGLGVSLRFITTIPSGSYFELDLLNRSVLLNGVTNRRATLEVLSKWFMLRPGANTLRLSGTTTGAPTMSVTYRSAWLY